ARLGLPSAETTGYRLINSEGDGLPGVVVDMYGDAAVVQFSGLGMKQREELIYDALERGLAPRTIFEAAPGGFAKVEGFAAQPRVVHGERRAQVDFRENGLELVALPLGGQKTGYFLDQRDNRKRIRQLAAGARVLDCYTYTGGFALAALAGGA